MTSPTSAELRAAVRELISRPVERILWPEQRDRVRALAADHERLERENERLREALEAMCWYQTDECDYECGHPSCRGRQMARALLAAARGREEER